VSSKSEDTPEAGSRWRKPPACEQRHRWRALDDPTRICASSVRARGREHSAMEGVLAQRGAPSLTRRHPEPSPATRGDGDAAFSVRRASAPWFAGSAEGARGRQRSCRKPASMSKDMPAVGLAQRRLRSKLHQDCAEPFAYPCGTSVSDSVLDESAPSGARKGCGEAEAGESPSSEAPPGWLTRHAAR